MPLSKTIIIVYVHRHGIRNEKYEFFDHSIATCNSKSQNASKAKKQLVAQLYRGRGENNIVIIIVIVIVIIVEIRPNVLYII